MDKLNSLSERIKVLSKDDIDTVQEATLRVLNGFGATFVLDLNNGKCRKAQLKDLENFTKISDYLENVHYCLKEVIPQDIPLHLLDLYAASVLLKNTDKHVHISIDTVENVDKITFDITYKFSLPF